MLEMVDIGSDRWNYHNYESDRKTHLCFFGRSICTANLLKGNNE